MKELDSREYECPPVRTQKVTQPTTFLPALCDFIENLHPGVKFPDRRADEAKYDEFFYDVADRRLSSNGYRLRVRWSSKKIRCAYKAVALDRYLVQDAPVLSAKSGAKTRFEENVYSLSSLFCRQTSVDADEAFKPDTVADWAILFPGVYQICLPSEPLEVIERRYVHRYDEFDMTLGERKAKACLELKFTDEERTKLRSAEFSWRYKRSESKFDPADIRTMRELLTRFCESDWCVAAGPDSAEMLATLW